MKFSASVEITLFVVWFSEISHEPSLLLMRTISGVILRYVFRLFLFLSFFYFFVDFTTC